MSEAEAQRLYEAMVASKGTCRSCGAEVYWARTTNGHLIPIDVAVAEEAGPNQFELEAAGRRTLNAVHVPKGEVGRKTHFATCPQADRHRRR